MISATAKSETAAKAAEDCAHSRTLSRRRKSYWIAAAFFGVRAALCRSWFIGGFILLLLANRLISAEGPRHDLPQGPVAPKPLFRDPIYDGAADPALIWNPHVRRWWMFYTNRRANAPGLSGVSWVHGTPIGIAESSDAGASWHYANTAEIELPAEFGGTNQTLWAPEVMTGRDHVHHMFLSVVPGIFNDWNHSRHIVHLTSEDLRRWEYKSELKLASDRVIDACILQLPDGTWRLWYNNERDRKSIYYADSADLENWHDRGKAIADQRGEGPKVFRWHEYYWMVTDVWRGLAVYRSDDALKWTRQPGNLLEEPGQGTDDQVKGGHPDVVVSEGRAFLFYFTHPGRRGADQNKDTVEQRRSSIQVVELRYQGGNISCDRDTPTYIRLSPPREAHATRFDFGSGKLRPGFTRVSATNSYSKETRFGFDLGSKIGSSTNGCTADNPFFFSVALPEGNYNVTATLAGSGAEHRDGNGLLSPTLSSKGGEGEDPDGLSGKLLNSTPGGEREVRVRPASTNFTETTIKAESRRLMAENIRTLPGQITNCTFTVNVRTPSLPDGGRVRLKPREAGPPLVLHWDEKLTLEFNGSHPSLSALEITPVDDAITVYLAGDSTVTDQPREPWNSWGQMLPRFFKPGVAVANHAESGESLPSFLSAKRFEKIISSMKSGDYLFIQFGHNDQKDKRPGAGPFTTYKTNLIHLITEARKCGGIPVLVTPMERKAGVANGTLGDFPGGVRQVAEEQHVPLIDLNAMSKVFYSALGTNLSKAFQDGTHHNNYGSYELAKCIVEGIKANKLELARFLAADVAPFDPAHPDSPETLRVPSSPDQAAQKPDGN